MSDNEDQPVDPVKTVEPTPDPAWSMIPPLGTPHETVAPQIDIPPAGTPHNPQADPEFTRPRLDDAA